MSYRDQIEKGDKGEHTRRIANTLRKSDLIAVLIKLKAWLGLLEPCEVYVVQHFSVYPAMIAEYFKWKAHWHGTKRGRKVATGPVQNAAIYVAAAIYYARLAGEADPRAWLLDGCWESGYWWLMQAAPRHTWPDWFAKEYRQHEEIGRVQSCRGVALSKTIQARIEMGLTDREIASELGLHAKTVAHMRPDYEDTLDQTLPLFEHPPGFDRRGKRSDP